MAEEAHVELMGKSYIHPLDVEAPSLFVFCPSLSFSPPFNSVSKSPLSKKGVSISDQTFLASGVPREVEVGYPSRFPILVLPVLPYHSLCLGVWGIKPSELVGIFGREKWARSHTYGSFFDSDWIRNTFSYIALHCLHSDDVSPPPLFVVHFLPLLSR